MPPENEVPPQGGNVTIPGKADPTQAPEPKGGTEESPDTSKEKPEEQNPLQVDIDAAISKARQDEKDKLYSRIEKAETERDAARQQVTELTGKIDALAAKIDAQKGEEGQNPKEEDGEKKEGLTQEELQATLQAATAQTLERAEKELFGPRIAALEQELKAAQTRVQQAELDSYRNSLIEANKGAIIPELVTGSSKEELDLALTKAKQVFARTAEALTSTVEAARSSGGLPPVPAVNSGTEQQSAGGSNPLSTMDVKNMSDAEFKAKRAEILRTASQQVQGSISNLD